MLDLLLYPPLITGDKKGKKKSPKPPTTAPITARSTSTAKLLIALSEGEVEATEHGTLSGRDIYLDGVPIISKSGQVNYDVKWEFLKGTQNQEHINSLPSVENYMSAGLTLKRDRPYIKNISNTMVDQVRVNLSFPSLQTITDKGDYLNATVRYAVDIATGEGGYVEVQTFTLSGRFTSEYQRTHEFDLSPSDSGWSIRVRRLTNDSDSQMLHDDIQVSGITEVIDSKLRYPNTALLYLEFDAEAFPQIPKVSVEMKGKIVRVPDNFDPLTRTYSGVWSGQWKWAYTNNPVWCLLDVLLSETYGTGERIKLAQVDKWNFYKIAQWCDVQVKDGRGGFEPRHSLNVYIQKQVDAWRLVQDICSNFNGNLYWNGTQVEIYADIPSAIEHTYNSSNVVDGKFTDSGLDVKAKYSQAVVSYDDPLNEYDTDKVPVYDLQLTRRFGNKPTDVAAFGVTSRGEAQRKGKWALMANKYSRMRTFEVGLEGYIARVGSLVRVASNRLAGAPISGRIKEVVSRRRVILDRECRVALGDRIIINMPNGAAETKTIQTLHGRNEVTVSTDFSDELKRGYPFVIDSDTLSSQVMRVLSCEQNEETFTITAVEYNESKQNYIDNGAMIEDPIMTITPLGDQEPPTDLSISQYETLQQGLNITHVVFKWKRAPKAAVYEVKWSKDGGDWINFPRTPSSEVELSGVYSGTYQFKVRALNAVDVSSEWVESGLQHIVGKVGAVKTLAYLRTAPEIMGISLSWGFLAGTEDNNKTVLQVNTSPTEDGATLLGEFGYPTNTHTHRGLSHGVTLFFRGRVEDKLGNKSAWGSWVAGNSSSDSDEILSYLNGQIDESHLGQHLSTEIEKIPDLEFEVGKLVTDVEEIDGDLGIISGNIHALDGRVSSTEAAIGEAGDRLDAVDYNLGDINGSITSIGGRLGIVEGEVVDLEAALDYRIAQIQSQIDQLETLEVYDPTQEYLTGEMVKFGSTVYAAKIPVPEGTSPPNETYWDVIGGFESVNEIVAALSVQIQDHENRIVNNEGELSATSTKMDGIYSLVRPPMAGETDLNAGDGTVQAGVWSVWSSISEKDSAMASRVDTVDASVGANRSAIRQEAEARVLGDLAINSSLTSLTSTVAENASAIQQEAVTRASADSAMSSLVNTLSSTVGQNSSALQQEITTRANETSALALQISQLSASVGDDISARITQEASLRLAADRALGQRIDSMGVIVGDNTAAIQSESQTSATRHAALSQRVDLVTATAGDNVTAIQDERTARADADTALSTKIDTVTASVAAASNAALQTERTARADADTALGQRIDTITTSVGNNTAAVQSEATARASADAALSQRVDTVQASIDNFQVEDLKTVVLDLTNLNQNVYYPIVVTMNTKAERNYFQVSNSLSDFVAPWSTHGTGKFSATVEWSAFGDGWGTQSQDRIINTAIFKWTAQAPFMEIGQLSKTSREYIYLRGGTKYNFSYGKGFSHEIVTSTKTWNDESVAPKSFNVNLVPEADAKKISAAVQTISSAQATQAGKLSTMWSVKMQINSAGEYVTAGIGLGIDNTGGTLQSQFVVQANLFAVRNGLNGSKVTAFAVQNNQVVINSALIGNATISMAKITNEIKSSNYVANRSGWILHQNGNFNINSTIAGQGRVEINNKGVRVYDSANRLRVKLGDLR